MAAVVDPTPRHVQVVRHERASIKADIWSYGILIWELISGQDITELQPLAIARQQQRKVLSRSLADCALPVGDQETRSCMPRILCRPTPSQEQSGCLAASCLHHASHRV